mmetsp:Transcript_44285/g.118146  ORF Transcript_44285/g.118146 Transcript_44285/m.118146 type:complete len:256 (+) Transcript_44285:1-768(+)
MKSNTLLTVVTLSVLGIAAVLVSFHASSAANELLYKQFLSRKQVPVHSNMNMMKKQQLVTVPKVGEYQDLPPGEYRTAGKGGMYSAGKEKKCVTSKGKTVCWDEVVDYLESKVVPEVKADCTEEGNGGAACGTLSWMNYFKNHGLSPSLAQMSSPDEEKFIRFFEYLGRNPAKAPVASAKTESSRAPTKSVSSRPRHNVNAPKHVRGARTVGLYQESFQQAIKAQAMYDLPSNDGYMPDASTYGRFGRNPPLESN